MPSTRRPRPRRSSASGTPTSPRSPQDDEPGLEGKDFFIPERSTFANGMHAVVVEIDTDTSEIWILRYAVVHDCGRLINPIIVEGQIHGGVAQGVGGALLESRRLRTRDGAHRPSS
ncbi:MAG: molybdopterin-dependent oxidoreductase [Aquabacterium sp.]